MLSSAHAHTVAPGEGRIADLGIARMRVLAAGQATTDGAFTLTEFTGGEGPSTVPHLHRDTGGDVLRTRGPAARQHHRPGRAGRGLGQARLDPCQASDGQLRPDIEGQAPDSSLTTVAGLAGQLAGADRPSGAGQGRA